jgi:hypothetical protein
MFAISGLRRDGSLPTGPASAAHWNFNEQPATAFPRVEGERVVLLGQPLPTAQRSEDRRFPELACEGRLVRMLTLAEVCDRLAKWVGEPLLETPVLLARSRAA